MAAMIMQHALMTMALTLVFAKMDSQEMDSIAQVTNQNIILITLMYKSFRESFLISNPNEALLICIKY